MRPLYRFHSHIFSAFPKPVLAKHQASVKFLSNHSEEEQMELEGKTAVVTGGGGGIGAAFAKMLKDNGAEVVVADLDLAAAEKTAAKVGGVAVACDVRKEDDIKALVQLTREKFGKVDIICSNAGLALGEPDHAASASNEDWALNWEVHLMSHVYAARAVLPEMIERGEGCLVNVASAAGLLNQIGDAAYSTTKHAAVGFAEALAITHGDDGIQVHVVCPQYIATALTGYDNDADNEPTANTLLPTDVAEAVREAIVENRFLVLTHPEVRDYIQVKAGDTDRWVGGMRKLRRGIIEKAGSTRMADMHKLM